MTNHKAELEKHGTNELIDKIVVDLESKILRYPANEERNKYLSIEKSITLISIPKHEFKRLVVDGFLKPYFLWDGELAVKRTLNIYEYNDLFYGESFGNGNEPNETVNGYTRFTGYVSPVESAPYFNDLWEGKSKKIVVESVLLIENLTLDSQTYLLPKHGEALKKVHFKKEVFFKDQVYKVYKGTENNYIDIEDCVFLKDDIIQIIENNKEIKNELEGNERNKYSGKELFTMIVPSIIRYIRERDQIKDKPQQDDGVGGLKKAVEDYIKGDESLKFLTSNFKKNWQTVINEKKEGQGKSILDKIFEEEIRNTKV